MDWPILVDSLNLAGVSVVPLTYAIDEHGIVRFVNPKHENIQEFISKDYERPANLPVQVARPPNLNKLRAETKTGAGAAWRAYADALFLWGGEQRLDQAIEVYKQALAISPNDSISHFRLGVSYRRRYDSERRRVEDFQRAVEHWTPALEINPNQINTSGEGASSNTGPH